MLLQSFKDNPKDNVYRHKILNMISEIIIRLNDATIGRITGIYAYNNGPIPKSRVVHNSPITYINTDIYKFLLSFYSDNYCENSHQDKKKLELLNGKIRYIINNAFITLKNHTKVILKKPLINN